MVYRVEDLEEMDPGKQAARIGHSVGSKKREEIEKTADEKGIRVLNRSMPHES
jgi:large subunit ribosomal protein L32e